MAAYEIERVLDVTNQLGEGPLWNVAEQAFYWVDILGKKFFKYLPGSNMLETVYLDVTPGCLAFNQAGGLVLATNKGFATWDGAALTLLEDNCAYDLPNRFNDGGVDRAGRLWAGTMSNKPENALYRLDTDWSVNVVEMGIFISNGIGWSPDNTVMYYSDSGGAGQVYAYDFDLATGALANRRIFLPPTEDGARADGLTVDSEGGVWIAFWDGWRVARYDPAGKLITEIKMPVQRPTSCNFGGPDLTDLYITSAQVDGPQPDQPLAGALFKIPLDVKGLPEPFFGAS